MTGPSHGLFEYAVAKLDKQHGSQIYEHINQWQDCCLLSGEYRPNGYSEGTLWELRSHRKI